MSKPQLKGAFQRVGKNLPHLPIRPKKSLICMVGTKVKPETYLFLELLAKQDEDTVSGTLRRIVEHFHEQWKQSVADQKRGADQ